MSTRKIRLITLISIAVGPAMASNTRAQERVIEFKIVDGEGQTLEASIDGQPGHSCSMADTLAELGRSRFSEEVVGIAENFVSIAEAQPQLIPAFSF